MKPKLSFFILVAFSLMLTACSSNPKTLYNEQVISSHTPMAERSADVVLDQAEPLPIEPGWPYPKWEITAAQPRLKIKGRIANYRVFSVTLSPAVTHRFTVNSWCVNGCLGFSKYVLVPYLILLNKDRQVLAEGVGKVTGNVGAISQSLTSSVPVQGTYYLVVAADNRDPGENVLVDNLLMVGTTGTPIAPLSIGVGSYPFGRIGPYLEIMPKN